jgi:hypothetical protein
MVISKTSPNITDDSYDSLSEFTDDEEISDEETNNEETTKDLDNLFGKLHYEYSLSNYIIKSYTAKIELANYTNKLSVNRKLTQDHYTEIFNIQNDNFINGKNVYFSGIVTLCNFKDKLYIIDGCSFPREASANKETT